MSMIISLTVALSLQTDKPLNSVTHDQCDVSLWLPSHPQDNATLWLVPNYTAWWRRHMYVNNLFKVII